MSREPPCIVTRDHLCLLDEHTKLFQTLLTDTPVAVCVQKVVQTTLLRLRESPQDKRPRLSEDDEFGQANIQNATNGAGQTQVDPLDSGS